MFRTDTPEDLKLLAEKAFAFRKTLSPESDRGCALMAAAFLDTKLENLIQKKLLNEPKTVKKFLAFNGVAGTFSSRIDFCFLIGLIPKSPHSDLHLIREIRNKFGHQIEPITFESKEIHSLCKRFQNTNTPECARPRHKFTNSCYGVLAVIEAATLTAKRFESPIDNVWSPERKQRSYNNFLVKFNKALEKITPEELTTPEEISRIIDEVLGSPDIPTASN